MGFRLGMDMEHTPGGWVYGEDKLHNILHTDQTPLPYPSRHLALLLAAVSCDLLEDQNGQSETKSVLSSHPQLQLQLQRSRWAHG